MRVLVTGGAGFIGSHLTDAFLDRGDEVSVVDDLSAGSAARLDERAVLHKQNIIDAGQLAALAEEIRPELICHLAAQIDVRASVVGPADDAQVNVVGTVNVLEAARRADARVLLCSTGGALYGRDAPIPSLESVLPLPESPYGIAKSCAEQYVGLYNRLHGTRHAVLRLANVYGPRQDPSGEAGVVAIFCGKLLDAQPVTIFGDGTQTRDYVYVGDVVRAVTAAGKSKASGLAINIGTGLETNVNDLYSTLASIADFPTKAEHAAARPGEQKRSVISPALAAKELGWRPEKKLADGLEETYKYFKQQRDRPS